MRRGPSHPRVQHRRDLSAGVGVIVNVPSADVLVVQPAENWAAKNLPGPFDGTRERRILVQGEMCAGAIIIFHVRQQQVGTRQRGRGIPVGSNRSAVLKRALARLKKKEQ
jgi:hypothetical protein